MNERLPSQVSDPQDPDTLARIAGRDMYGTVVGTLRRVELWRLANAWGMTFPVGASKDFMLPFFVQLEVDGKNPLKPPGMVIEHTAQLRARDVRFSKESHAASADDALVVKPEPISEFEERLLALPMGQLKRVCKLRGVTHSTRDRKTDLVARIMAASGGNDLDQDTATGD